MSLFVSIHSFKDILGLAFDLYLHSHCPRPKLIEKKISRNHIECPHMKGQHTFVPVQYSALKCHNEAHSD